MDRRWLPSLLLQGLLLAGPALGTFSTNFLFFLEDRLGREGAAQLARTDVAHGYEGSFGGGNHTAGNRTRWAIFKQFFKFSS